MDIDLLSSGGVGVSQRSSQSAHLLRFAMYEHNMLCADFLDEFGVLGIVDVSAE